MKREMHIGSGVFKNQLDLVFFLCTIRPVCFLVMEFQRGSNGFHDSRLVRFTKHHVHTYTIIVGVVFGRHQDDPG